MNSPQFISSELAMLDWQLTKATDIHTWWVVLTEVQRCSIADFHHFQRPLTHGEINWAWKNQYLTYSITSTPPGEPT